MENVYARELSAKLKGMDFEQGEKFLKSLNKNINCDEAVFGSEEGDIFFVLTFAGRLNRKDNFFIEENELRRIVLKVRLMEPSEEELENMFQSTMNEGSELDIEGEDLFYLVESGEAWDQYLDCGYQDFFKYFDAVPEWYVVLPDDTCYCEGAEEFVGDLEEEFGIEEESEIETNIENIKHRVKVWAGVKPKLTAGGNISHPVLKEQMQYIASIDRTVDILEQESFELWKKETDKKIMECDSVKELFSMLRPEERMTNFRQMGRNLSDRDFSEMLAYIWTTSYSDFDISDKSDIMRLWFMDAQKEYLMTDAERQKLQELPEKITIYRGVQKKDLAGGMSWTLDKETAKKYATQYKMLEENYLYQTEIEKSAVMAYFTDNDTVIIDPYELKKHELLEMDI